MELTVSSMRSDEASDASRIIRDVILSLAYYNDRAKSEEVAKLRATELQAMVRDDPDSVLLARTRNGPVGFCLSRYDDGLLWLSWFGVVDGCRQRGVGRALLDALGASSQRRRAHKIWCDTRTENISSQRVLEGAGFKRIACVTNHWYGQDFFLWEWYPRTVIESGSFNGGSW